MTPRSSVVGGFYAPGRVTHGNQVRGEGPDKVQLRRPYDDENNWSYVSLARTWVTGTPPGARPGGGARGQAPGGRACTHGARPGTARSNDVGPPSRRFTTSRRGQRGRVQCKLGGGRRWGPWRSDPRLQKLWGRGPLWWGSSLSWGVRLRSSD